MLNTSRILNVLFSVMFLSSMGFSQEWTATINAAGGSSEYGLTFGFNPNATDDWMFFWNRDLKSLNNNKLKKTTDMEALP